MVNRRPGLAPAKAIDVVVVPVELAVLHGFELREAHAYVVGISIVVFVGLSFAVGGAAHAPVATQAPPGRRGFSPGPTGPRAMSSKPPVTH